MKSSPYPQFGPKGGPGIMGPWIDVSNRAGKPAGISLRRRHRIVAAIVGIATIAVIALRAVPFS